MSAVHELSSHCFSHLVQFELNPLLIGSFIAWKLWRRKSRLTFSFELDGDRRDGGLIEKNEVNGTGYEVEIGVAPVFRLIKDNTDRHGPQIDQASEQWSGTGGGAIQEYVRRKQVVVRM